MKHLWLVAFWLTLAVWCQPLGKPDAQLLQLINEGRDESTQLSSEQVRVLRPLEFPELTLIGFVVGVNDCLPGQALLEGKFVSLAEACGLVLRSRGWEQAAGPAKIELAMKWLEVAQLGFGDVLLRQKPNGFGERGLTFSLPDTLATLNGSVRVICWIESPPGASERRRFRRVLYWFGRDARIQRAKVLEVYDLERA